MPNVTFNGDTYSCAVAYKGQDYVHLVDSNGNMIASFDGVSDFSRFTIANGSWTSPAADHDCHVAVIREDGGIGKGGHRCSTLLGFFKGASITLPASGWVSSSVATAEQTVSVSGMTAMVRPLVELDMSNATASTGEALQEAWGAVGRVVSGAGKLTFYAYGSAPTVDLSVFI